MNQDLLLPLAAIFDLNIEPHMIAIILPVAVFFFGTIIAVFGMHYHHTQKKLLHDTARIALEKGQSIPPEIMAELSPAAETKVQEQHQPRNDIRAGLILIGVGIGLFLFFQALGVEKMRFVGAIPGFIGVALLLFGSLSGKATSARRSDNDDRSRLS